MLAKRTNAKKPRKNTKKGVDNGVFLLYYMQAASREAQNTNEPSEARKNEFKKIQKKCLTKRIGCARIKKFRAELETAMKQERKPEKSGVYLVN